MKLDGTHNPFPFNVSSHHSIFVEAENLKHETDNAHAVIGRRSVASRRPEARSRSPIRWEIRASRADNTTQILIDHLEASASSVLRDKNIQKCGTKKKRSLWNQDALFSARVKRTIRLAGKRRQNTIVFNYRKFDLQNIPQVLLFRATNTRSQRVEENEGEEKESQRRGIALRRPSILLLRHYHHPLLVSDVSLRRFFRRSARVIATYEID